MKNTITRWWHLKVLRHKPIDREVFSIVVVLTCQCGVQWVDQRNPKS